MLRINALPRLGIVRRGNIVDFMRARKARIERQDAIYAAMQQLPSSDEKAHVPWDGFVAKEKKKESSFQDLPKLKKRPHFDETLFDDDFRANVIEQTATEKFNDFDWRKMDEVKQQMRLNKCNIFCMDVLWNRLTMAARPGKPATSVPKLVEEFDREGNLIWSNRDEIKQRKRVAEQWASYGPMARRAYTEVNRLKNQMQTHLDKFDIKIIDHTYAACTERRRSYADKKAGKWDPFLADGAMKIAFKVRDEDIDKLWGLIKQDNEPYSGLCLLYEKPRLQRYQRFVKEGRRPDIGLEPEHDFIDLDYLYETFDRNCRFYRITQAEFGRMEYMNRFMGTRMGRRYGFKSVTAFFSFTDVENFKRADFVTFQDFSAWVRRALGYTSNQVNPDWVVNSEEFPKFYVPEDKPEEWVAIQEVGSGRFIVDMPSSDIWDKLYIAACLNKRMLPSYDEELSDVAWRQPWQYFELLPCTTFRYNPSTPEKLERVVRNAAISCWEMRHYTAHTSPGVKSSYATTGSTLEIEFEEVTRVLTIEEAEQEPIIKYVSGSKSTKAEN